MTHEHVDTVVVGAGISGLAYAHGRLPAADLLVVDGADRAGGLIRTQRHGDVHFECGPEALASNAPPTLELFDELGLTPLQASAGAHRRYVLHERDGLQALPGGPKDFLKTKVLSWPGKLRALTEPWRRGDVALDGSLADFVRHRLGAEVLARLVDPAVSGIYASDPELVSLRAAFPSMHALVAEHGSLMKGMKAKARARRLAGEPKPPPPSLFSAEGGLESLPASLARALGERLRLSWPVASITREGDGWLVAGQAGGLRARHVVVALPASRAADALAQGAASVSQELRSMTSETVLSVAHVWPREAVGHPLNGFGYLVSSVLGRQHLGTLFSSSIQPGRCPSDRVVLRTLLGGTHHPELAERSDSELVQLVTREVGPVLDLASDGPTFAHVSRWRAVLPRYDLDQPSRQDRIDALLRERPGLALLGNHRRGISVNALIEASRKLAQEHGSSPELAGAAARGTGET